MNKLTLPRWWEALLLLLPIVGTAISMLILFLLPIGVIIAAVKGSSLKIVKAWPLIQGMLLIAPIVSSISLIGSSYIIALPPIGNVLWLTLGWCVAAYVIVGVIYNKAVVEVSSMSLLMKAMRNRA